MQPSLSGGWFQNPPRYQNPWMLKSHYLNLKILHSQIQPNIVHGLRFVESAVAEPIYEMDLEDE